MNSSHTLLAPEMDAELHCKRIDGRGNKVTYESSLEVLPDGCFIQIDGLSHLLWKGGLLLWSPGGYVRKHQPTRGSIVTILTPEPIVQCFRHGYTPEVHESSTSF